MTLRRFMALVVPIGYLVLVLLALTVIAQTSAGELPPRIPLVERLRVWGGIVGMAIGGLGALALVWMNIRSSQLKSLEKTNDLMQKQIGATEKQVAVVTELNGKLLLELASEQAKTKDLQLKTDLTMVLGTLKSFIEVSEKRYDSGMKVMEDLLKHLGDSALEGNKHIARVLVLSEGLSRRFGVIENALDVNEEPQRTEKRREPREMEGT